MDALQAVEEGAVAPAVGDAAAAHPEGDIHICA